ncbi:MAG: PKD domain-containing protein [Saprospiraceae bacterium]|nr:PKD domain-containing protein [Saprospiraceae bacterium]
MVSCRRTVIASVEADSVKDKQFFLHTCDVSATLTNKSVERANIFNFVWQIYQNGDTLRYTDWNPTIQFRDSGMYRGKLLLNPNTPCNDTALLTINVSRAIKADFSSQYDTCVAGEVSFTNKTKLGSFPLKEIVWDYSDGKRDTNTLNPKHQYETPGLKPVKLTVKDKFNCKKDITINLVWQPAPPILIVEPDKFAGCTPAKVFFNNKSKPIDSTYKIRWDFGDGDTSKRISPTHVFTKGGTFNVNLKITSPIGCYKEQTFSNRIKIRATTKADFDFSPTKLTNLTPSVFFTDKSEMPVAWHWNIGKKGISLEKNPNFRLQDTGFHTVKLMIRNPEGCLDSITKTLYVEPTVTFFMPNAFSPNNDSANDEFKGTGFTQGMKSFHLAIWNRWGEKIFDTTNPEIGWNG